jgi:hypothetical protein
MSQQKSGLGCFVYGCLISVVLALGIAVALYFYISSSIRGALETYTSAVITPVPTIIPDSAQSTAFAEKLAGLSLAVTSAGPSQTFTFSPDEINQFLVSVAPELKLHEQLSFSGEGEELQVRVALPVEKLAEYWSALASRSAGLKGRYFNGFAKGRFSLVDGEPTVKFSSLELNGHTFPEMALSAADSAVTGFVRELYKSFVEEGTPGANRVASMTVAGGALQIVTKPSEEPAPLSAAGEK